jgi:branched-chain amino acid transport system substrate-binding protein
MTQKRSYLFTLVVIFAAISLVFAGPSWAKVEGDTIIFGAAVSFTGKYSTNGKHTKNGYDLVVKRVNEMGGVKVGDKTYKIDIKYYDDESTPARAGQLADRLIKQDDIKFILSTRATGTYLRCFLLRNST